MTMTHLKISDTLKQTKESTDWHTTIKIEKNIRLKTFGIMIIKLLISRFPTVFNSIYEYNCVKSFNLNEIHYEIGNGKCVCIF